MRFIEITESAHESAEMKKARLNKLFNERASMKEQLRHAREEKNTVRINEMATKLGRIDDAIEALQESASPSIAAKARLAQLKADYAEMPKNPGNQEGYDALDDMRDEIKKLEAEVASLTEGRTDDADTVFEHNKMRARVAMDALTDEIEKFSRNQKRNARDWGYAGSMGLIADKLEELVTNFGG